MEEWRTVPGWEKYEVSDLGRVRRKGALGFLKQHPNEKGYLRVVLSDMPRQKHVKVHRIVFHAFAGYAPPELNHKDLDKAHCAFSNLEPSDRLHNAAHAKTNGCYDKMRRTGPPYVKPRSFDRRSCERCGAEYQGRRDKPTRFCSRDCANLRR
jgi:hypothetical protein